MKLTTLQAALGSTLALNAAQAAAEGHAGHRMAHQLFGKRGAHEHHLPPQSVESLESLEPLPPLFNRSSAAPLAKRAVCSLPDDPDLVVVPGAQNGGWAMAPDVQCTAGSWCPIACVSGKVMAQWKPGTTYTYPESMDGGLYCGDDGTPVKSFEEQPYCVDGTGSVSAVNNCGSVVSFCQTVLPGDEGMYIPTDVTSSAVLAVPDPTYWDSTAAHYYINPPGTAGSTGCVWGTEAEPIGNWAPYVAGANTDSTGETFVKIGWNPIFTGSSLAGTAPTFGIKIECSGSGCNGLPCSIGSDNLADFSVTSDESATGAGDADFCVVTVPSGGSASIVVYNFDGSSSSSSDAGSLLSSAVSSLLATSSSSEVSSTSTSTSSSIESTSSTSTSSIESTTSTSTSTTESSTSTSSTITSTFSTSSIPLSTSVSPSSLWYATFTTASSTLSSVKAKATLAGGIFHENSTATAVVSIANTTIVTTAAPTAEPSSSEAAAAASTTSTNEGAHRQGGAAMVGLLVAVVASLWLC